jgi:hypothetical protein
MAKSTAKKNVQTNQTRMLTFLAITVGLNVCWLLYALYLDKSTWTTWELCRTMGFWLAQELLALRLLWSAGAPVYHEGQLVECIDLSDTAQLGFMSYAQDLLWVCWIIQFLSQFVFRAAWLLYLVVPGYAFYKLWQKAIGPFLEMRRQQREAQANGEGGGGGADGGGSDDPNLPMDAKSRFERRKQEMRDKTANRGKKP